MWYREVPCALLSVPPLVTFFLTVDHCQTHEINTGINVSIVFVILSSVDLYNHHCSQEKEVFHYQKEIPFMLPLYGYTTSTSHHPWPLRMMFLKLEWDHVIACFKATITDSNFRIKFELLWLHTNMLISLTSLNICSTATLAFSVFL